MYYIAIILLVVNTILTFVGVWKFCIGSKFKYRLSVAWKCLRQKDEYLTEAAERVLTHEKFHLVTYHNDNIQHMNTSFNQIEVDYDWLDKGCEETHDMQQQDENMDYVKNLLNGVK
jgi:hypothetical protein